MLARTFIPILFQLSNSKVTTLFTYIALKLGSFGTRLAIDGQVTNLPLPCTLHNGADYRT